MKKWILILLILIFGIIYLLFSKNSYEKFKYEYKLNSGYLFENKDMKIFIHQNELIGYEIGNSINIILNKNNTIKEVKF